MAAICGKFPLFQVGNFIIRFIVIGASFFVLAGAAQAADVGSAYTQLDSERDCSVFAADGEDGQWSNLVCSGYKGYPVFIYQDDARESLFYGFPPQGDAAPKWESFAGFNNAGPRIEWRIEKDGAREKPFATIHRWFVAGDGDTAKPIEVLAVEKVGQIGQWQGCAVGYVVATGNKDANETARRIADEKARGFTCGVDRPETVAGSVPVPDVTRD